MHGHGDGIKVGQVEEGIFPPETEPTGPKIGLNQGTQSKEGSDSGIFGFIDVLPGCLEQ